MTDPPGAVLAASSRVFGRLIPNAWVGPPTTSRSMSPEMAEPPGSAVSAPTSITRTGPAGAIPSAIASAIACVLPYIDS